jgi:sigma-B regulation protein RsbU (phosphoserine phosphatase)
MPGKRRGVDRRALGRGPDFPLTLPSSEVIDEDRRAPGDRRRNGFISKQPFFNGVPYSTLEPLAALCRHLELQPGEVLVEPGQENRHLYLLLDGLLTVRIDNAHAKEGFLIAPGECVGEISIVDRKPTTAYVVAAERSRILAIPDEVLWEQLLTVPMIARNFMRLFADRFRARSRAMQEALKHQLRWEHLQRELTIARDIQSSMLPTSEALFRRFPQVDLKARMTPAFEVGGDFFDAFPLDDRNICLAIGDVSGKGIPASLFMVRTLTLVREEMLRHGDPCASVRRLNAMLCPDNPRCMFASLIVGVLDVDRRCFSFVNAGHPRPLFGVGGTSFEFLDPPSGLVLGVDEQADYEVTVQKLTLGDTLVLYSDGVTEAMNKDHQPFSEQRLRTLLSSTGSIGAEQMVDAIESAIREHAAGYPQSDDLTLLVLRMRT